MKLTIINEDKFVAIDEVGYEPLDMSSIDPTIHAVQWFEDLGWIEYKAIGENKPPNQTITSIEQFQTVINEWNLADYAKKHPPAPTPEEIKTQNKEQAESLLQATDWTCTIDINNPQYSNPYLMNQSDFLTYRSQVRQIAVNPPIEPVTFPTVPTEVWSS